MDSKTSLSSSWNESQEHLAARWTKDCRLYSGMHTQASRFYYFWGRVLGVPVIFFSAVGGVSELSTLNTDPDTWIKVVKASVLIVLFILATLSHYLDFSTLSSKHKQSANSYEELRLTIEEELVENREKRKPADTFLTMVRKQLAALRKTCPVISDRIIDQYVNGLEKLKARTLINTESDINDGGGDVRIHMRRLGEAQAITTNRRLLMTDLKEPSPAAVADPDPVLDKVRDRLSE